VSLQVIEGDDLLAANYPAVHTVGRAAARTPALIDLSWSPTNSSNSEIADAGSDSTAAAAAAAGGGLPLVALVGKGVCFDTGGLDLKTAAGMKLMKKVRKLIS
jgi:leucyl aminopeptidase